VVQRGLGRQEAHALLAHHYRQLGGEWEDGRLLQLWAFLEDDESCPLTREDLEAAFDIDRLVGAAVMVAESVASDEVGDLMEPADPAWPGDLV
jgi:hypothetical protein